MRTLLPTLLAAVALLGGGCTKLPDDGPTGPDPASPAPAPPTTGLPAPAPTPEGGLVLGGPSAPAPEPSPGSSPTPPPTGSTPPPSSSGCGAPAPPDLSKIRVSLHIQGPAAWTLDATPLVGPDTEYCALIGYTDGRQLCPVRPEGHPERVACETWLVGVAVDTGRAGPTWRRNGALCTGPGSGCENDGGNQYLLRTFDSGTFTACATSGVCGELAIDR